MREWVTSEFVISLLLVTTFICVGLLALWAAASKRHWFVRTLVVFAALSPIQIIPAYELYLACAVAVAVTWSFFAAQRLFQLLRAKDDSLAVTTSARNKFSLSFALLFTAAIATALAVGASVTGEAWQYWSVWSTRGAVLSVAFLFTWMAADSRLKRWQRICLFVAAAVPAGITLYVNAGELFQLVDASLAPLLRHSQSSWWWILVGIIAEGFLYVGIVLSNLQTYASAAPKLLNPETPHAEVRGRLRPVLRIAFLIAVVLPPAITMWELAHPLAIPNEAPPSPNAIKELVRLSQKVDRCKVLNVWAADVIDHDQLAVAVAAQQADYDEINRILQLPSWIPVRYDMSYIADDLEGISARRQIARLLSAKCDVEMRAKKVDEAISTERAMLKLAELYYQGGFAVDFLVANSCESIAQGTIYRSIDLFDKKQCDAMQQILVSRAARRRPIDDTLYREHVFMQRNMGWFSHLAEYIQRVATAPPGTFDVNVVVRDSYRRAQAIERLLMLKVAAHAYQLDHDKLPTRIQQLVPTYISALPVDPFDPTEQPLRCRVKDDTLLFYSVDVDGDDDGGKPERDDPATFYDPINDGDLTLEATYPPDVSTAAAGQSSTNTRGIPADSNDQNIEDK